MKKLTSLLLACSIVPCISPIAHAAPETSVKVVINRSIDPAAIALLDKSAKAYAALDGLSMDFKTYDTVETKDKDWSGQIAFSRRKGAKVEFNNGGKLSQIVAENGMLYQTRTPKVYGVKYLLERSGIEATLGEIPTALSIPLAYLAIGQNPLNVEEPHVWSWKIKWTKAELLPDNGVLIRSEKTSSIPEIDFRLFFGKNDMLLRRVEASGVHLGKTAYNITTISQIRTNPSFAPESFVFQKDADAIAEVEPPRYDPKLKVGGEPFPLNGADLSKYRGQVVLLDFRGLWSIPTLNEIPIVRTVYEKYQSQGFEVLGINQYQNRIEMARLARAARMKWPQIFDEKDAPKSDVRRYGIVRERLQILIGRDGKIAAINPKRSELEGEVVKALEKH